MAKGPKNLNNAKQQNLISPRGNLGGDSSGDDMSFDGQDISPAAKIMREVARASQKSPAPASNADISSGKVSAPKSKSQSKSYSATTQDKANQSRPNANSSQKVKEKSPESPAPKKKSGNQQY